MGTPEVAAARLSEIANGEMKEVTVGETPVLLARVNDKCYAVGAHCTHYGAPLVEGALIGDRIICPWHHACFNAKNGNLEEPPALDSLANYNVRTEGDEIFVDVTDPSMDRRTPEMPEPNSEKDSRVFVIIGGGAAGYMAAQTLREDGFEGRIRMITRESQAPYDRPNLSKDYLHGHAEPEWIPLRPNEFYEQHGIEILFEKEVTGVDSDRKVVLLADGENFAYDRLLVATGGIPRRLDVPGADLKNIFVLRSFDNADEIIASASGAKHAVVVGAGFIGMEAAFSLRKLGMEVTVVSPEKVPFEKILGAEIGKVFQREHENHGVRFVLGETVTGFTGKGTVAGVLFGSGQRAEADLVIVGIGVKPATDVLTGLALHNDGGVIGDESLRVADSIYAAGDIVHLPDARTGEYVRIEHWRTAQQQGRIAAHNMAGKPTRYNAVPFFWTTQFGITLNYVGHAHSWDEVVIEGDTKEHDFLAYYVKGSKILAAAGMSRDHELAIVEELMRLDKMPSVDQLKAGSFDLSKTSFDIASDAAQAAH
jgi:NADPH-dependent 2,4-dienoyl-CoA reductase/sulfur reductase-like enzyme/nitrite reductase/ring-hydroxylating ferredoxin subunit